MTDWEAVRSRIQARRQALGLSQAQLGKLLGINGSNVAQVEGGLPISEKKLDAFAKALGVSAPFLRYGLVTAFDRATIEGDAYRAGRASALDDMRNWLAREELRTGTPGSAPGDADAAFTDEHFIPVSAARRAAIQTRRDAADRETTAARPSAKKGGRRAR